MKKYDATQIDDATLFERRKQAVRLYRSGKCRSYAETVKYAR